MSAKRANARLAELGLELPEPAAPGANYVPFVRTGDLVVVTGQLSQWNGERRFIGKLGLEFDIEEGHAQRDCVRLMSLPSYGSPWTTISIAS